MMLYLHQLHGLHLDIGTKNTDSYVMKELVMIYTIRAWILQLLPPRLTHWLVIGK